MSPSSEQPPAAPSPGATPQPQASSAAPAPSRLACPVCARPMSAERQYRITLDICEEHGVWFDRGELPELIDRLNRINRIKNDAAVREATRSGKLRGIFGGWVSLLFD